MPKIEGDWEALAIHKLEKLRLMFLKRIILDIRVLFKWNKTFHFTLKLEEKEVYKIKAWTGRLQSGILWAG